MPSRARARPRLLSATLLTRRAADMGRAGERRSSMSRIPKHLVAAAAVVTAVGLGQGAALARSATATHSISTPRGTVTESVTKSYSPQTGVASETVAKTGPQGRTATLSLTSTPDGRGGFTDTRSVTNFDGKTATATRQVGR